MLKPAGSSLYWHADNNHPRCDITNLVDAPPVVAPATDEQSDQPNRGRNRKK